MPDVISLLSSPVNSTPRRSPRNHAVAKSLGKEVNTNSFARDVFNLSSDGFSFTEDTVVSEPRSKKRKLDLPVNKARPRKICTLLSDEDDSLTISSCRQGSERGGGKENEPFNLPSDPIITSSAPEQGTAPKKKRIDILDLSDELDLPEDIFDGIFPNASQPTAARRSRAGLSERTVNLLANLGSQSEKGSSKPVITSKSNNPRLSGPKIKVPVTITEDIFSSSVEPPKTKKAVKSVKRTEDEKVGQASGRAEAKGLTNAKEAEKERKRLDQQQKALEKQKAADIAEVNRAKTDKKASLPEMIVEMDRSFESTSVGNQVVEYMKQAEVECSFIDIRDTSLDTNPPHHLGKVITWKRKVTAVYNEDLGHWEPLPTQRIDKEPHVLIYLTAIEFATIAANSNTDTTAPNETAMKAHLDGHITNLCSTHPNSKPIYLIEGLTAWLKRNQNAKNRAYTAAVRSQDRSDTSSSQAPPRPAKKRKTPLPPPLDLSIISSNTAESLFLHLQLHPSHPKVHLTTNPQTTAAQILSFTTHISTVPHRQHQLTQNLTNASFCMTTGQIRTGTDAADTYVRMLQEIHRVTPAMAYAIAVEWKNVRELVKGFKEEGPLMLENVRKAANKDGGVTDRRLGAAVSRRLYKVFLGREPGSMDV